MTESICTPSQKRCAVCSMNWDSVEHGVRCRVHSCPHCSPADREKGLDMTKVTPVGDHLILECCNGHISMVRQDGYVHEYFWELWERKHKKPTPDLR